ncbi:MAG: hypothetical protein EBR30_24605 [Cytophagia bacterium]|nr:hypothetical protein [Cytophagia bacterium]NBW38144.1 hypothetical protein [Cytophagia bacterium]
MIMKKYIIFLTTAFFFVCFNSLAQNDGEFTVPLSDPAKRIKLVVDINYGGIVLMGTPRKDVLVRYASEESKSNKSGSTKDGMKRISSGTMDLEVSENQNSVRIESSSWSNKMNLYVEIPFGADVTLSSHNSGNLSASAIQGQVELETYNGKIYADRISGSVVASTYNGEVKISFDKVTEGTPMSFSTYNGDIDITVPANFKGSLKMRTEQGEVFSDFDVALIKSGPIQKKDTKSGVYKVVIDEWVKGDINGGGPEFMMKTYNGDILVRKK